jgi:membrane protein insertase Oxa1/YidC/SpoIIIJ
MKTIFLQLWVSLGLFNLFFVLTQKEAAKGVPGLYEGLWNGQTLAYFGEGVKAFGNIEIAKKLTETGFVWLPVVNAFFTYLAMRYSFKYTLKPRIRELTKFELEQKEKIKIANDAEGIPDLDPEKIAAQSQAFNLYLIPVMTTVTNFFFPTGLNIYYCFLSILFFVRTWLADVYYRNHQMQYMTDILESDPIFPYEDHMKDLSSGNFDLRGTPSEILYSKN